MDEFDIKLLDALQADGRLTNNDLGDRVGLSASQCSRRRMALEQDGVIENYHAQSRLRRSALLCWRSSRCGSRRIRLTTPKPS